MLKLGLEYLLSINLVVHTNSEFSFIEAIDLFVPPSCIL